MQIGELIRRAARRIGKDGIHGATFSSEELHQGSPQTAVQIGDPITQKRMSDFILKARDMGLYNFITDNGAGGLSSSVGETAEFCGGCDLDLKAAPLKYEGLASWEILVSEAQERMNLAVPPDKINDFLELAGQMDVEATVLGDFNDNGYLQIRYGEDIVGLMEMEFLHQGVPRLELTARWCLPTLEEPSIPMPADCGAELHALLARLNICSKEYFVRQYDHEVQARSVIKPLMGAENDGPSDAAVIRIDLDSNQGLAVSHGICPRYSDLDSYWMAANALDEAVRNALAVGANPDYMAALDNFCWCDPVVSENNPQGEYKLAQLVRANQALYKGAVAYSIPLISGKDSMKNDYISESGERISIPPTLLISLVGEIPVLEKAVSMDFKKAGDLIYLVGETKEEMGGSEYFLHHNQHGGQVPRVDFQKNIGMYRALHQLMLEGRVLSCHDCSDGGLAVALAECCLAGNLGAEIDLSASIPDGFRDDFYLFSESAGRLVITLRPWNSCKAERLLKGFPCVQIGEVRREKKMQIKGSDGRILLKEKVLDLKQSWQRTLRFGEDK